MIEDSLQGSSNMSTTEASESAGGGKSGRRVPDPRNEDFIIKYEKENFSKGDQEGGTAEFYQLISVVIGMIAFVTRHKAACWVALFFYYSSSINARSDARLQHVMTGISIVLISFVNLYMTPETRAVAPPPTV